MSRRITIPNFRVKVAYGSHLPVLMKVLSKTTGPVLELGSGWYSTMFLHWACKHGRRHLLTCDSDERFIQSLSAFQSYFHDFALVDDWNTYAFGNGWEVVFIDTKPPKSRADLLKRFTDTPYVILHDTEDRNYAKYGLTPEIMRLYKSRYRYKRSYPPTSVLSNKRSTREVMR